MSSDTASAVALAHLLLPVTDLAEAISFFEAIGARTDVRQDKFAVVEFRDRTRLQLSQSGVSVPGELALQFDFKVEDIDAAWRDYDTKGLAPGEITRRTPGHDSFLLRAPDGWEIKINSGYKPR